MFRYVHKGIYFDLTIEEPEELKVHEETREERVTELMYRFENDGNVKHPIIADRKSLIILDGAHRIKGIKRLKLKYAPVCFIGYESPTVILKRWTRMLKNLPSKELVKTVMEKSNIEVREVSREEAEDLIEKYKAIALIARGWSIVLGIDETDILERYRLCKKIEDILNELGVIISYESEENALSLFNQSFIDGMIIPPQIDKKDVLRVAEEGKLFPPRSTRHFIPGRPLNLFVPLEMLKIPDIQKARESFSSYLRSKKMQLMPAGSKIGNRVYEEEVFIFE